MIRLANNNLEYKVILEYLIMLLEAVIHQCEFYKLTDTQWFIELEDKLNKLSVKNHEI